MVLFITVPYYIWAPKRDLNLENYPSTYTRMLLYLVVPLRPSSQYLPDSSTQWLINLPAHDRFFFEEKDSFLNSPTRGAVRWDLSPEILHAYAPGLTSRVRGQLYSNSNRSLNH